MSKHFKLRIYRAILGFLQMCRSTDPSALPENPIPLLSKSLHDNHQTHARRRRVFSASTPIAAGTDDGLPLCKQIPDTDGAIYEPINPRRTVCSSSEADAIHAPPPAQDQKRRVNKIVHKKMKKNKLNFRTSTSSAESVWFSSECAAAAGCRGNGETETLVSSTDSSTKSRKRSRKRRAITLKRPKRGVLRSPAMLLAGVEIPARLSVFKKLIPCSVEGKVKESFAVVKRSEDPHEDFKNSMLDMILEKQMFDRKDLEQLLECFLSLNSRPYHGIIVQAFSEVWEAVFSPWADSKIAMESRRRPTLDS